MKTNTHVFVISAVAVLTGSARAQVTATTRPSKDATVSVANPNNNYGIAGKLTFSAPDANGEFQTVMAFDLSSVKASLDEMLGISNWQPMSLTLKLFKTDLSKSMPPYNPDASGDFQVRYMPDTSWIEGGGDGKGKPVPGITYATLPGYLAAGDIPIANTSLVVSDASMVSSLPFTAEEVSAIKNGGQIGLHLLAADSVVSYIFDSREGGQQITSPALTVTAAMLGDANQDGIVNSSDFDILALNFNQSGKSWSNGDFNGDGVVNALDFNAIATNFGRDVTSPAADLPEPEFACVLAGAVIGLRCRRRNP